MLAPQFKSKLDLERFQQLVHKQREHVAPSSSTTTTTISTQGSGTKPHPHPHYLSKTGQLGRHTHGKQGEGETRRREREGVVQSKQMSGEGSALLGEGVVRGVKGRRSEADFSDTMTEVSELSSIPLHPDLAAGRGREGNITVDSEASSVYNASRHAPPPPPRGQESVVLTRQQEGGVVVLPSHPLHFSRKVAHQQQQSEPRPPHRGVGGGMARRDEGLLCSEKTCRIHDDLGMLEKVQVLSLLYRNSPNYCLEGIQGAKLMPIVQILWGGGAKRKTT